MFEEFYFVADLLSMWVLPIVWLLIEVGWLCLAIYVCRFCHGVGAKMLLAGATLSTLSSLFDTFETYRYNVTGESLYDGSTLIELYGMGYSYLVASALILPGLLLVLRDVLGRLSALEAENACLRDGGTEKGATRG